MSSDSEYEKAMAEMERHFQQKKMLIDQTGDGICPHCGRRLRGYEGLRECWCKFCGGKIRR